MVFALEAKSRVERVWTNSIGETVAKMAVLKEYNKKIHLKASLL